MLSENGFQLPGFLYGKDIDNLPQEIKYLYNEARECFKAGAYTGVVLLARKCLANVAIYFGAEDGQKFIIYVDYLTNNGYIAPKSKNGWMKSEKKVILQPIIKNPKIKKRQRKF